MVTSFQAAKGVVSFYVPFSCVGVYGLLSLPALACRIEPCSDLPLWDLRREVFPHRPLYLGCSPTFFRVLAEGGWRAPDLEALPIQQDWRSQHLERPRRRQLDVLQHP